MRRPHLIVFVAWLAVGFHACDAWACRYNVLEVGFIDLGIEPYRLFGYVPGQMSPDAVSAWCDRLEVALVDTNIQFELVRPGHDADHPALEYLPQHEIEEFPAVVLVSPDGQSLPITLTGPDISLEEALDSMLVSAKRAEILRKTAESYGVVLLIEGPDETANAPARDAAQAAVAHVGAQMEFMPKPIARGPQVVTLAAESVAKEKVLLWSLGTEPADINEPHAAIFYGRGRWIGPLFRGGQITQDNLANVLFVIGADCECGLDHRWLQGTMLPARWDEGLQATAAETLGFDPESPMIKMEMISIVRRGMGGAAVPGVPFGYREIEVGTEWAEPVERVDEPTEPVEAPAHDTVPPMPETVVPGVDTNAPSPALDDVVGTVSPMPSVGLGVVGLLACVAVAAAVVLRRSRKV